LQNQERPAFNESTLAIWLDLKSTMAKPALGKGLGALINARVVAPAPREELGERIESLPLDLITPSPLQPRQEFRNEHLQELVESIRERGIIQPLIVRKVDDKYELIAGERRWRAARELQLAEAPAIVRTASDREVLELALIENLQREDLNPIEEAGAYERLHRDFGLTQEEISKRVGKSRASVANAMRLLDLDSGAQALLKQGRLSVGHAKVLLSLKSHEEQRLLMDVIVRQGASVRVAEKLAAQQLVRLGRPFSKRTSADEPTLSPAIQNLQNLLTRRLATRVVIHHAEKRGSISIEYYGTDDLHRIISELGVDPEQP
jgi:ParB family transcriptional regulator, chromosome partitioning protein